jgi:hypothetical protein
MFIYGRGFVILVGIGIFLGVFWPVSAIGQGINLLSEVKGDVKIQRKGTKPQKIIAGKLVQITDVLILGRKSSVKVTCENGTLWNLKTDGSFKVAEGCGSKGRAILKQSKTDRIKTRSLNKSVPYIISPQNTVITEAKPLLKWNPVAGSKTYTVSVTGPNLRWEISTEKSQFLYGGPELQSGSRYRVTVTTENGASSVTDRVTGFSRLDSDSVRQITEDAKILKRLDLSEEAQVLALAHLENGNELYAEAIDRLEQWLKKGNKSAAGYKLLGDLYWQIGLPGLAREQCIAALPLMRRDENLSEEAEILNILGQIDRDSDRLKAAIGWLEESQKHYRELGSEEKVQQLEKELTNLRERV